MKKKIAMLLALCMIFAMCVCGNTALAAEPELDISERTIRFSTTSAEGNPVVDAMHVFADLVAEATEGKITVELYPGSQLGNASETMKNVQLGVLDMTIASAQSLATAGATDLTALSLPFIFRDNKHIIDVLQGDIGKAMLAQIGETGTKCVGIGFWEPGSRNFYSKVPITCIDDIKGMKIRCQQLDIDTDMVKALGASPTPIAAGEVYSSLQTGVVDGADQPISGIYSQMYYEVCKNVTLDGHTAPPVVAIYSEILWKQLSADEQNIIQTAWDEAVANNLDRINGDEADLIAKLEAEGVTFHTLTDREKWVEAMQPVFDTYAKDCMEVVEAIQALN